MTRRAFTLIEILAAVTLAATLVVTGGIWLLGVQRSAQATRSRCVSSAAMTTAAIRLRDDLIHATSDRSFGERDSHGAWLMTVAGREGGERHAVAWSLRDGLVSRTTQPAGGPAASETIATGIDVLEIRTDGPEGPSLRITAGGETLALPVVPGSSRVP